MKTTEQFKKIFGADVRRTTLALMFAALIAGIVLGAVSAVSP